MDKWKNRRAVFYKSLEHLIEMKHITVNKLISLDSIAAIFASDLAEHERELEKSKEIQVMMDIMLRHFPEMKVKEFFKD